jgi:peptidoglycan/LPS O-acetylase OafA/YrhL
MTEIISHPKYRPDIDGLRAIAVWSVLIFHAFPSILSGGFAGVDVFFVISGFLISTIIFQNIDRGTFSIADFYSRRVRRIFPALGLVLLSVLVFGWFCLFPDEFRQLGRHTASSAGFIQNVTLWKEVGYFDNSSETKPLLHIWSLGIEEQFYLIWPLMLSFAAKIKGNRDKQKFYFLGIIAVFVTSFALNLGNIKLNPSKTFYLPQYRFWELSIGGILSWVVLYKPTNSISYPRAVEKFISLLHGKQAAIFPLDGLGLAILCWVFVTYDKDTPFPGVNALIPVLATAMIIFAGPDSFFNRFVLSNKIFVWFGLISFPLYLWHWPILSFGRIIYGEDPELNFRIWAVVCSIFLSWLTVKFVEKPFRFTSQSKNRKFVFLLSLVAAVGGVGLYVKASDGRMGREGLKIKRVNGFEDIIGMSDRWYKGKSDWLFLGNAFDKTVSKLKLSISPAESDIQATKMMFSTLAANCASYGARVVLLVGPNKSSIYPEYLPDELKPSSRKYVDFFLKKLGDIPNLTVYNPTFDLLSAKTESGLLYYRTDTHWNNKGAFTAFTGFLKILEIPFPEVEFGEGIVSGGDLIGISGLKDFPLHPGDNWTVSWRKTAKWTEKEMPGEVDPAFGPAVLVSNKSYISDKRIWVVGDSFTNALRQYFNFTFKEVYYLGHWSHKLQDLPKQLAKAEQRPDIIVVVRVERSF